MGVTQYTLVANDWLNLAAIINDLTQRVVGQELHPRSDPTFADLTLTGSLELTGDLDVGGTLTLDGLTASRIVATDASKGLESVDLVAWVAGTTDHISVTDDSDGTVTLDLDANTQTLLGSFNGTFLETIDFTVSEAGGTVTGSLEQEGTGDLTQKFSDGYTTLDCTGPQCTINLTSYVGTNAIPKEVFVYILQSAKTVMVASNTGWPTTEHIKVANLCLKSAVTTGTDNGALCNRNWNDHAQGTNSQGHITHLEERIRQLHAHWKSGTSLTLKDQTGAEMSATDSGTAIELVVTAGKIYQLHKQTFPASDMYTTASDDAHIANQVVDEGGNYTTTVDLVTDITRYVDGTNAGGAINTNRYFNLVVWGVQNRSGEASHLMINLPIGTYNTEAAAIADADGTSVFDIPQAFEGTGFLIARLTLRLIAGSQWTYIAIEDLRGQEPGISAGVGVSTTAHTLLSNLDYASSGHTGIPLVTRLEVDDSSTYIDKDGSNNMTFTDVVVGTRTLKQLGCPTYKHIKATTQSEGDLHLSDGATWAVSKAMIHSIRVITSSTNWDLYVLQNDNGFSTDDANIPKFKIAGAISGDANIMLNFPYEDEDATSEVHLYYLDNSGTNTADIYVLGFELL